MHINVPWLSRATTKARKNGRKIKEVHVSFIVKNPLKLRLKWEYYKPYSFYTQLSPCEHPANTDSS